MKRVIFVFSLLILISRTALPADPFTPEASLCITEIVEHWVNNSYWMQMEKNIIGYDDKKRKIYHQKFIEEPSLELWDYYSDSIEEYHLTKNPPDYVWETFYRITTHRHQLTDTIISQLKQDNQFVNADREIILYNEAGKITQNTYFKWSETWKNRFRSLWEYDEKQNITEYVFQIWESDTSEWIDTRRESFVYDNDKNLIKKTFISRNHSLSEWEPEQQDLYRYYAESGNIYTEIIHQRWTGDGWDSTSRIVCTRNGSGILIDSTQYGMWATAEPYSRWLYTYDFMGNILLILCQNYENGEWVNFEQTRYEYAYYGMADSRKKLLPQNKCRALEIIKDKILISPLLNENGIIECRLHDLRGRLIVKEKVLMNRNRITINTKSVSAYGTFFLCIANSRGTVIYKEKVTLASK